MKLDFKNRLPPISLLLWLQDFLKKIEEKTKDETENILEMKRKQPEESTDELDSQLKVGFHQGQKFLFAAARKGFFENKDVSEALARLPETLAQKTILTPFCEKFQCYSLPPSAFDFDAEGNSSSPQHELTFYQSIVSVDPNIRKCRIGRREVQRCKEMQETRREIELKKIWNPPQPSTRLSWENPKRWIAYLIESKSHTVAAYATGNLASIDTVEIHPRFRGQGLCSIFLGYIFHLLKNWGSHHIKIWNAAEEAGFKCYQKAGTQAGYRFTCKGKQTNPCEEMLFDLPDLTSNFVI